MISTIPREPGGAEDSALSPDLLVRLHDRMLLARCLEERLIRMNKQGDGFFWVGGPGEEALNVALGLLVHKGQGPAFDYLHLHYRSTATLLAMGAEPIDTLRQMKNTATDPYSAGRNFCNHYSVRKWNVVPVSSPTWYVVMLLCWYDRSKPATLFTWNPTRAPNAAPKSVCGFWKSGRCSSGKRIDPVPST